MIIKHKELIERAKELLKSEGFKSKEIMLEYGVKIGGKVRRVDVVGINSTHKFAVECGSININIEDLKRIFDKVILLPYVKKSGYDFSCANCGNTWKARIEFPRTCPKCHRHINFIKDENINGIAKTPYRKNNLDLEFVCQRCGYDWIPKSEKVFVCPSCKSPKWNECEDGIIRGNPNLDVDLVLDIIINNPIFQEDLMEIGNIVRSKDVVSY